MTAERRPRWYDQAPPPAGHSPVRRHLEAGAALGAAIGVGLLAVAWVAAIWWLS